MPPRLPEVREERGVVRNPLAPAGYVGYVAVAVDGVPVQYVFVRREAITPADEERHNDELWAAIERYEANTQSARLSLPIVPAVRDIRLIG
jgi:hypothetical protein